MRIAEDMAFTLDYILSVGRYAFVPETGYLYRRDNEGSATSQKRIPEFEEGLHAFKKLYKGTMNFVCQYHLSELESAFRISQRGTELQQVFLSLYRGKRERKERIHLLKASFALDELSTLSYAKGGLVKNTIFFLVQKRLYGLFDVVALSLMSIKYRKL